MPLIAREDRKLLISAGIILVLVITAAIALTPSEDRSEIPTTYSSGSKGAKAAYLLLKETGYNVERWEQPAADLPSGAGNTLVIVSPSELLNEESRTKLRNFVASGGRLVAVGLFATSFLPDAEARPEIIKTSWTRYRALTPSATARLAPDIAMAPEAYWTMSNSAVLPLYGDDKHVVAVQYRIGQGEIIWWGGPTPLTNAGMKEPGNLEFFLSCIGDRPHTRILWDEYMHGYRRYAEATPAYTQIKWLFLQFGLLAMFAILTYSRRSGPVRPAPAESRLSPLEFVETLGGVYDRAKAGSVAVEVYYQRFRYWVTRRLGVAPNTAIEDLERQIRERWHFSDPALVRTLQRCESARFEHDLAPSEALRLVQALHDFAAKLKLFPASPQERD